jgi:CubicO group peptidase (beta-lactamase class C family)
MGGRGKLNFFQRIKISQLARFAALVPNQGSLDGFKLFSPETITKMMTPASPQVDLVMAKDLNVTVGGFGRFYFDDQISLHGWGGAGGSMVLWDPTEKVPLFFFSWLFLGWTEAVRRMFDC